MPVSNRGNKQGLRGWFTIALYIGWQCVFFCHMVYKVVHVTWDIMTSIEIQKTYPHLLYD